MSQKIKVENQKEITSIQSVEVGGSIVNLIIDKQNKRVEINANLQVSISMSKENDEVKTSDGCSSAVPDDFKTAIINYINEQKLI